MAKNLDQVNTMSRKTSHNTTISMSNDKQETGRNDFELQKTYLTFLCQAEQEGLILRDLGVSFNNLSVYGKDQPHTYLPTMSDVLKVRLGP
ncbi:hypothetical protein HF325_005391 [Metschnikowia pulcherrima]|uniref:Pleiotropic ABC efflux transporter N-terminal domain-containing protein n=1 Tax=Metschnikowia pulcherrima TaxID=27326 RepID=A0A8H7LCV9_9ASCO|nr:hypothetical protein HF325_005391 [Metschnikowia pulcherrima]